MFFKRKAQVLSSQANVTTPTPERYAKQLVAHLGRKVSVTETDRGSVLAIGAGQGIVTVGEGALVLTAEAPGEAELARVQDVLGRHLERFGTRAELTVEWSAAQPVA
jgi:hypothetical protein